MKLKTRLDYEAGFFMLVKGKIKIKECGSMDNSVKDLYRLVETSFPGLPLKFNVSWKEISTFGIGGVVPILAEPPDDIALVHVLKHCVNHHIPIFILGAGSNLVGSEQPFEGLVIHLNQNDFVRVKPSRNHVTAGAGIRLHDLCVSAAHNGFGGCASLSAIPGSLGGALRMNASADGQAISDHLTEICGYDFNGDFWSAEKEDINWGYRCSSIPENVIITAAIFKFNKVDPDAEVHSIKEAMKKRRRREPKGRSAGCVFRNPSPDQPAGKLIDEAGCKGLAENGIMVSDKHANYFINKDGATIDDFIRLASKVRKIVHDKSGIWLRPEIHFFQESDEKRLMEI